MDFKVVWSEQAITGLRELCSFIAERDPQAAERMGKGILDHVRIFAFLEPIPIADFALDHGQGQGAQSVGDLFLGNQCFDLIGEAIELGFAIANQLHDGFELSADELGALGAKLFPEARPRLVGGQSLVFKLRRARPWFSSLRSWRFQNSRWRPSSRRCCSALEGMRMGCSSRV